MRDMQMIPTRMHGMPDYLLGAFLIASPWIFGFADESGTAKWTFIAIGIAMLATATMTNYEFGVVHAISMHMHLGADMVLGLVLAISPWVFGYANDTGKNGWLPALIIGIAEIGLAAMTRPWPAPNDLADRERRMTRRSESAA
jgi:hypothetical protein